MSLLMSVLVCPVCAAVCLLQYVGPELDDPSSNECMQFMQRVGRENWKAFANKKPQVGSSNSNSRSSSSRNTHWLLCVGRGLGRGPVAARQSPTPTLVASKTVIAAFSSSC